MPLGALLRRAGQRGVPGGAGGISWADYQALWEQFGFNGSQYMVPAGNLQQVTAEVAFRNPIVLACVIIRASVFAEIRIQWQRLTGGRAARALYGTPALGVFEHPWPGAGTGHLLTRSEVDVSRYGNSYWKPDPAAAAPGQPFGFVWIDPTRMKLITGDVTGPTGKPYGQQLLAYQVQDAGGKPVETFLPDEILHYRPIPDPTHPFRGISWLSSLLPDVTADQDLSDFKHAFLRNAATPNLVVKFQNNLSQDAFNAFRDRMESGHTGPQAGFKTLYLGAGADVKTVGSNFDELNLADNQSYGETRIAVAAGVPASMLGIAEGMKGSTLNTANYAASRRRFSDVTIRPLWRDWCVAAEVVAPAPAGSRLWYDDRDAAFLQADMQDAANERSTDATTIAAYVAAGFTPESAVAAVSQGDITVLEHTGLYSVQLQPPGELGEPGGPTTEPAATPDDDTTPDDGEGDAT